MLQDPAAVPGPQIAELRQIADMRHIAEGRHVGALLESIEEYQRLVALIKAMTKEIERLHDDNAQLRAAVNFYREAVRACKRMGRRSARASRTQFGT